MTFLWDVMFGQHGKMGGASSFEVLKQLGDLPWISSMIPPSEARNTTCDSTKMKREVKFQPTKTFHPPPNKKPPIIKVGFSAGFCVFGGCWGVHFQLLGESHLFDGVDKTVRKKNRGFFYRMSGELDQNPLTEGVGTEGSGMYR